MAGEQERVTAILEEIRAEAPGARERLLELVYTELKRLAQSQMRREAGHHTLQPTALVHEAYLRMLGGSASYKDRGHFFAAAARVMRSVLVDFARAKKALKRGGARARVTWQEDAHDTWAPAPEEVLAVHEALQKLEAIDPKMSQVVELRFFAGLQMDETAAAMGVSERSVYSLWEHARAWLYREIAP